jgi:hypothetical protein
MIYFIKTILLNQALLLYLHKIKENIKINCLYLKLIKFDGIKFNKRKNFYV